MAARKSNKKKDRQKARSRQRRDMASGRACGLCGKTKNLTKTECCGHWICDDVHEYVLFSYASNSCYRNHTSKTICGFHAAEGHAGRWQDCQECREAFEPEAYAWYATNEYNFEKLPDPPACESTTCHGCGRVIALSEGGYSSRGGHYFCGRCTARDFAGALPPGSPGARALGISGEHEDDSDDDAPTLDELASEVPLGWRDRFHEIVRLTDAFCQRHLDEEYRDLSRDMAVALCCPDSPAQRGKPAGWAAGIVYAVGWVNFLTDPQQIPHMTSVEIADGFGVSSATMMAKAKVLREGLGLMRFDPTWTLPSRLDDNPLVWLRLVNGLAVDLRKAPREVQQAAYEQGLIPYIPADRKP